MRVSGCGRAMPVEQHNSCIAITGLPLCHNSFTLPENSIRVSGSACAYCLTASEITRLRASSEFSTLNTLTTLFPASGCRRWPNEKPTCLQRKLQQLVIVETLKHSSSSIYQFVKLQQVLSCDRAQSRSPATISANSAWRVRASV